MRRIINNIVRVAARLLVLVFTSLAFISALVIALTQVSTVRDWVVEKGLTALNKELRGHIEVGSISGNLITGFSLHNVRVVAGDTTLLATALIDIRYQFRPIVKEKTINAEVVIHNPVINLIRSASDSLWNFEKLVKQAPPTHDTTSPPPFPFVINMRGIEIIDATITVRDLTQRHRPDTSRTINLVDLDLTDVNLSAIGHYEETDKWLALQHVGMTLKGKDVRIIDISGQVAADAGGIRADGLRIETEHTLMTVNARLDSVDLFSKTFGGPSTWQMAPIALKVDAPKLSIGEVRKFLPELSVLGGTPSVTLDADGTFGNIRIKDMRVALSASRFTIAGRLRNLHRPDSLFVEARITDSKVNYSDVPVYAPGLPIPDLAYLGNVDLRNAEFVGTAKTFTIAVDATSQIGTARGAASLDLRGHTLRYTASVAVAHANAAPVLNNEAYASDFTGHILVNGEGLTLATLNTSFHVSADASTVAGRSFRRLIASGSLRDNGVLQADTVIAVWGPKTVPNDRATLDLAPNDAAKFSPAAVIRQLATRVGASPSDAALIAGGPSLTAGGTLDLRDRTTPHYVVHAQGRRFALVDIIPDASSTRMSFTLDATGSSFDPEAIEGAATFNMNGAELPDGRKVLPFGATVTLVRSGANNRTFTLRSEVADADVTGQWNFATLLAPVQQGLRSVTDYLGRKSRLHAEDPFAAPPSASGEAINATYGLTLKDLAPLEVFLGGTHISAQGELHGEVSGTAQLASITANGTLSRFALTKDSLRLQFYSAQIEVAMRNVAPGRIDDIASIDAKIHIDSTARYNDIIFNAPRLTTSLENGTFHFNGATGINGKISVAANGAVNTSGADGYSIALDTVRVGLPANGIIWRNVGVLRAVVSDTAITIDSLALQRNAAEVVEVRGTIAGSHLHNVTIEASQGSLHDLAPFFVGTTSYEMISKLGGWIRGMRVQLNGTFEEPEIEGLVAIDSANYGNRPVGNIQVQFAYAAKNLTGSMIVSPDLLPVGTEAEAAEDMVRIRERINRRLTTLNTLLPPENKVPLLADSSARPGQLEAVAVLSAALQKASTYHSPDSLTEVRLNRQFRAIPSMVTQLRLTLLAEARRGPIDSSRLTARINIRSLPVDLALAGRAERVLDGGPVEIEARTDSLPIAFLAPFASGVQIRGGTVDLRFNISGKWPRLTYSGDGRLHEAYVLVPGNNMFYSVDGKVGFHDQVLTLNDMTIGNDPRDLPNGSAALNGTIAFDGFQLKDLDVSVRAQQLMVLNEASQSVNEMLYGPLVIASGTRPLRFSGTLDRPKLEGDVDVIRGNLYMERSQVSAINDPNPATYVDISEWRRRTDSDAAYGPDIPIDTTGAAPENDSTAGDENTASAAPGSLEDEIELIRQRIARVKSTRGAGEHTFADNLQLDLGIGIRGRLYVTVNFSPIEQLRAVLGSDKQTMTIKRYANGVLDLRGGLKVLDGSKFEFIKSFDASGDLAFAGDINRTRLSIVAQHNDRRIRGGNAGLETYQVIVTISGTLEKPDIKLSYNIDGKTPSTVDQDVLNRNAIALLLFGFTIDEVHSSEHAADVTNFSGSLVGSGTSSIASRLLTEILTGGTDFIRSIDLDLSGQAANARLTVVSQFGDVIVRAGGEIINPLNNGTLVVEAPLFDLDWLRNFAVQFEAARQSSQGTLGSTTSETSQTFRIGVQYREVW